MGTKTAEDLADIQNYKLDELPDHLVGLDVDDLTALRALEVADKKDGNRKGALEMIDVLLAEASEKADKAAANQAAAASSDAAGADVVSDTMPAWQAAAYTGPLTIAQADWRRHNLKPVGGVATK